jgi:hypothetical protein
VSDALVAYMTWDRLVPWKVLSLPERVTEPFYPVGYGSKHTVFRGRADRGATLWVVTKPQLKSTYHPTLVAKIRVLRRHSAESGMRPRRGAAPLRDPHQKAIDELLRQWGWVAESDPRASRFFELNDASAALGKLNLTTQLLGLRKIVKVDAARARDSFRSCTRRAKERTVFISYAHADAERLALDLAEALLARGFSPWLDALTIPRYDVELEDDVRPYRLGKLIELGIQRSQLGIALVTHRYAATTWTRRERDWLRRRSAQDARFRCLRILGKGRKLSWCDAKLDPAPPDELASQIKRWWAVRRSHASPVRSARDQI